MVDPNRGRPSGAATPDDAGPIPAYVANPEPAAGGAILPGLAQGFANTVNGVQDAAIGTGHLAVRGVNAVAGYRVLDERVAPDWSRDLLVYQMSP